LLNIIMYTDTCRVVCAAYSRREGESRFVFATREALAESSEVRESGAREIFRLLQN